MTFKMSKRKMSIVILLVFVINVFIGFKVAAAENIFLIPLMKQSQPPESYGNITLNNYAEKNGVKPVVFSHGIHRMNFTCKVCHSDIGFAMKAGLDDIKMGEILEGKWCGVCHNGKVAFAPVEFQNKDGEITVTFLQCNRCHSKDIEVKENHDLNEVFSKLPSSMYGNKVNWVKALEEGHITPRTFLSDRKEQGVEKGFIFKKDIEFEVSGTPPNVIFPHKAHTEWLHCNSCHPKIFKMKAGASFVTMTDIFEGRFCGVCHGKVAFPVLDCFRCHK